MDAITAEVIGPSGSVYLNFDVGPDGGKGTFQPDEVLSTFLTLIGMRQGGFTSLISFGLDFVS